MTDHGGSVIRRVSYFPWGQDRGVEGTFTPKLQFNFKEKDATGFYDYGARIYNPVTGRWLSPDTAVEEQLNRYTYVHNNPLTMTDPTGHWPTWVHDYILRQAFPGLTERDLKLMQKGSLYEDVSTTVFEVFAPRHGMTPGYLIRKYGFEEAKAIAQAEAANFIGDQLAKAEKWGPRGGLDAFGHAAHTIMDAVSPAHLWQPYDTAPYFKYTPGVGTWFDLVQYKKDMDEHTKIENRLPTSKELSIMIRELRDAYRMAFGYAFYLDATTPFDQKRR